MKVVYMCRMTMSIIDDMQIPEWKVLPSTIFFYFGRKTIYEPDFSMGYVGPNLGI
jgi:hypothetical protein